MRLAKGQVKLVCVIAFSIMGLVLLMDNGNVTRRADAFSDGPPPGFTGAPGEQTSWFDFDGDGKTDIGIFRPAGGEWWINRSSTGVTFALQFGASTDKIAPADYTGDGKADIAFWRPSDGNWYVLRSEDNSFFAFPFGANGDIPAPADYDADGKADSAVFRPSSATWFISQSGGGGTPDIPVRCEWRSTCRSRLRRRRKSRCRESSVRPALTMPNGGYREVLPACWRCSLVRIAIRLFRAITPETARLTLRSGDHRQANGSLSEAKTSRSLHSRSEQMATCQHPETTTVTARPTRPCSDHRKRRGSLPDRQPEHRSCNSVRMEISRYRMHSFARLRDTQKGGRGGGAPKKKKYPQAPPPPPPPPHPQTTTPPH